jgi:hypothetical protein
MQGPFGEGYVDASAQQELGMITANKYTVITHQQDNCVSQHGGRDGASIQSPSANTVRVDIDTLHIVLLPNVSPLTPVDMHLKPTNTTQNQTKPTLNIQRDAAPEDPVPIITFKPTSDNAPADTEQQNPPPSTRQTEPPTPDYDADPDEASTNPSGGEETRNPASANQAIAGMSVGLVLVMLIFTVFL